MTNPTGAEAKFHDDFYAGEVERIDRSALIDSADYFSIPLGFVLPGFPRLLTRRVLGADALLRAAPLLRSLASSFAVYARR